VKQLVTFFGLAFTALLPLINPVGSALIFVGLVGAAPAGVYRTLAKKIAVNTTLFLAVIELIGAGLLKFFGISLPVMQVAGGLVLAAMGWTVLNGDAPPLDERSLVLDDTAVASLASRAFYPFTFPVTAGPACVVVVVTLSAQAAAGDRLSEMFGHTGIFLAVVLLSAAVYVCYSYAPAIAARVPRQTVHGILRVIAFLLMCIGVQITWNGLEVMLKSIVNP
jgi:multiple antibiotic resistance protein